MFVDYTYFFGGLAYIISIIVYAHLLSYSFFTEQRELYIFITTIFFLFITNNILGIVWNKGSLFFNIKNGNLNRYLFLPTNTYINYYSHLKENFIFFIVLNMCCFGYFLIALQANLEVWLNVLLTYICILIFGFGVALFIDSLSWIAQYLNYTLDHIQGFINELYLLYPYSFFSNFPYKIMLIISYAYFITTLIIPQLVQNEVIFYHQTYIIVMIGIFLIILSCIIWKFGLKNYAAYN